MTKFRPIDRPSADPKQRGRNAVAAISVRSTRHHVEVNWPAGDALLFIAKGGHAGVELRLERMPEDESYGVSIGAIGAKGPAAKRVLRGLTQFEAEDLLGRIQKAMRGPTRWRFIGWAFGTAVALSIVASAYGDWARARAETTATVAPPTVAAPAPNVNEHLGPTAGSFGLQDYPSLPTANSSQAFQPAQKLPGDDLAQRIYEGAMSAAAKTQQAKMPPALGDSSFGLDGFGLNATSGPGGGPGCDPGLAFSVPG